MRPFRLACAPAPPLPGINLACDGHSPVHSSIGTPSSPYGDSDGLSAHGFRDYFTPLPGGFSPFPHGTLRYRCRTVASLGRWAARIPTRFHVPGGTWEKSPSAQGPMATGLSPSGVRHSNRFPIQPCAPGRSMDWISMDFPTTRRTPGNPPCY
jgi:hypothetical protein